MAKAIKILLCDFAFKKKKEKKKAFASLDYNRSCIFSSPPGSSVHGIFQARVLEWGAIAFFKNIIDNVN